MIRIANNYTEMLRESGMMEYSSMSGNIKVQNIKCMESTVCTFAECSDEDCEVHGVRSRMISRVSSGQVNDFGMRSQESCRYVEKVQVRLSDSMKQVSTADTVCPAMNVQAKVQSDRSCVNERKSILSSMRMKVHGSSSISSTRNVKTSTVQPHCSELGKVQGAQVKTMSAKGDFSKTKNENLKFAGKAKTMGDSNLILESK